jgi:ATP-dependent Clp protease protease subunit
VEKVAKDMERDYFMTSQEALEYGLIDRVLAHRSSTPTLEKSES